MSRADWALILFHTEGIETMNTEFKRSPELQAKIDVYNAEVKKQRHYQESITQGEHELQTELETAKQAIEAAMQATIENPTGKNRTSEAAARAKVRELSDELATTAERRATAYKMQAQTLETLRREILQMAKDEAQTYHFETVDAWTDEIIAAREAYLQKLIDYREYIEDVQDVMRQVSRDTGIQLNSNTPTPQIIALNYFGTGYSRRIGITEYDTNAARREGTLLK